MSRWFVSVFLMEMTSEDSGDWGSEGDFYFETNDCRYPSRGNIKLSENELFNPDVPPTLWSAMVDGDEGGVEIEFKVCESDAGADDDMLEHKHTYPLEEADNTFKVSSKNGKVQMIVRTLIQEKNDW